VIVARNAFRFFQRRPVRAFGALAVSVGVLTSGFLVASAAPVADTDLTGAALKARKAVGLPAVTENAGVLAAARAVLDGGNTQAAFASNGGTGDLITATSPAGEALSTAPMQAVVFDPRLTAVAVLGRGRNVAVAAALDSSLPFPAPVLAGAVIDPGVVGSLAVLFPPRSGTIPQISLHRKRGAQSIAIGLSASAYPGAEGAVLVALQGQDRVTGPQIGYGLTYTLKIGTNRPYTVRTRPIPSVVTSRGFVPGPGFTGADRLRFMQLVASLPSVGRKIVDVIGGAITVSILGNTTPICGEQTSCAGFDPGNGYFIAINRAQLHDKFGQFAIPHELGHLVDFLGLDSFSHEGFRKLFSGSPNWKNCFPVNGQCAPFLELFADQFGFYSTNRHGVQSGYGDARLATGPAFSTLLQAQWAFRPPQERNPLAGYGPLAKSFESAMHSSASAL
jgi:hypothetical protein